MESYSYDDLSDSCWNQLQPEFKDPSLLLTDPSFSQSPIEYITIPQTVSSLVMQSPTSGPSSSQPSPLRSHPGSLPTSPEPRSSSGRLQLSNGVAPGDGSVSPAHGLVGNSSPPGIHDDRLAPPASDYRLRRTPSTGSLSIKPSDDGDHSNQHLFDPTSSYHDSHSNNGSLLLEDSLYQHQLHSVDDAGGFDDSSHSDRSNPNDASHGMEVDTKPTNFRTKGELNIGFSMSGTPSPVSAPKSSSSNNFVNKLYLMINDPLSSQFINWTDSGTSFVVSNASDFSRDVLGKHFKHNNFSSFVRQLNMYGFHKMNRNPRANRGVTGSDNQIWEFSHPRFQRGRAERLEEIRRKENNGSGSGTIPNPNADASPTSSMSQPLGGLATAASVDALSLRCQKLEDTCTTLVRALGSEQMKVKTLSSVVAGMWRFLEQDQQLSDFLHGANSPDQSLTDMPSQDRENGVNNGSKKMHSEYDFMQLRGAIERTMGLGLVHPNQANLSDNPPIVVISPDQPSSTDVTASLTLSATSQPNGQLFSPLSPSPHPSPTSPTYSMNQQIVGRQIGHRGHGQSLGGHNLSLTMEFQGQQQTHRHAQRHSLPENHISPINSPFMTLPSPLSTSPRVMDQGATSPHIPHFTHARPLSGQSPTPMNRNLGHNHSHSLQITANSHGGAKRSGMEGLMDSSFAQLTVGGLSPSHDGRRSMRARSTSASNLGTTSGLSLNIQTNPSWTSQASPLLHESDIDGRPLSAVSANGSVGFGQMGDIQHES